MLVPLLALSFQLIPPIILFKISDLAYMEPRHFSELWEQPISLMALVFLLWLAYHWEALEYMGC